MPSVIYPRGYGEIEPIVISSREILRPIIRNATMPDALEGKLDTIVRNH